MEVPSDVETCSRSAFADGVAPTFLYRGTRLGSTFVRRRGVIAGNVFVTYRDPVKDVDPRMWFLTKDCEIEDVTRTRFVVAEEGWTPIAARMLWRTHYVDGYVITLSWPNSGLMAGTVLVLGFDTVETAAEWRTALTNAIMGSVSTLWPGSSVVQDSASELRDQNPSHIVQGQWAPLKELDGLPVYYEEDVTGGAYMVSTVIHACPKKVLDALSTGSFLLCCGDVSLVRRDGDVEVLHLKLQPVGLGNWLLTPREVLLERMYAYYTSGTVSILFKSCDQPISEAPKENQPWWSWFTNSIQAHIPAAGFTVSPHLSAVTGQMTDTLLSLVLKIDFGGICSEGHPLKPVVDGLGVCQTWIDRILHTVTAIKATVEGEPQLRRASSLLSSVSRRSLASFRRANLSGDLRDAFVERQNSMAHSNGVLNTKFWSAPGSAGFEVRGVDYLKDRLKIPAEEPRFRLDWVCMFRLKAKTPNISRFLPALRAGENDFTFVMQVMLPGPPFLSMVIGWTTDERQNTVSADAPNKDPFETAFLRFLQAEDVERDGMFKLIPKVVEGRWFIRRAVGHTPVLLGKKLRQSYHIGPGYCEVDIDIASSRTASTVIGIVQGATRSLTVDLAVLIQGNKEDELPESLLGTVRLDHVDLETAVALEVDQTEN